MATTLRTQYKTLDDWIYHPTEDYLLCDDPFHPIMEKVYSEGLPSSNPFALADPNALDPTDMKVKIASLLYSQRILLCGDVIYIREGDTLHILGDAQDLLAYYMHTDTKEARKAISLLETTFQGYFPVADGLTWRNVIRLDYDDGDSQYIDLTTLDIAYYTEGNEVGKYPEFGSSQVIPHNYKPIQQFFAVLNSAIGEPYFFEKTMMYHFNQKYREKSHVLVGGGGNGKSMFMGLIKRLYGSFALTDASQPNFVGHSAQTIAYNFIGKRIVTFNDVNNPDANFLEWMKRMITGNLDTKTPAGAYTSFPCNANFLMETNHTPQILSLEAHRRRFIVREFPVEFRLKDYIDDATLDMLGDYGDITAGDLVNYFLSLKNSVDIDWTSFANED